MVEGAKKPVKRLRRLHPRAQRSLWGREPGLQAGWTAVARWTQRPPPQQPHSRLGVSCDLLDDLAVHLIPEVLLLAQLWGQEWQVGRAWIKLQSSGMACGLKSRGNPANSGGLGPRQGDNPAVASWSILATHTLLFSLSSFFLFFLMECWD